MYEITVEAGFSATHSLLMADGAREPVHGHDWRVIACVFADALDDLGFVADFEDVRQRLGEVTRSLHHRHLNDHAWFADAGPSAENVAATIHRELSRSADWGLRLKSVSVEEAPGCRATFLRS